MIIEIILAVLVPPIIYGFYIYIVHMLKLQTFPSGPFPLPVIGNLNLLGTEPHKTLNELAKTYGDVFSISFGMERVVIVNSIKPAREALITKGQQFAGRPTKGYTIDLLSRGFKTISFSDYGPMWVTLRKFGHSALKMYGEGMGKLENMVVKESEELHARLQENKDEPVELHYVLGLPILNIICHMVFGQRYEPNDKEFKDIIDFTGLLFSGLGNSDIVVFLPWLRFLPLSGLKNLREALKIRDPLYRKKLLEHRATFDENNIRDFTDALLLSVREEKTIDKAGISFFTDDHIEMIINDVFVGGTETTLTTLRWGVVYLLHWPQYQDDLYNEITKIVGDRYPLITDRDSLPLVQAAIQETLRLSALAPLGVPHKTTVNCELTGISIPKDTQVLFNIWSMHNDPNYWDDPAVFNPYRWLNADGEYVPGDKISFLPFSAGRRVCLGEALAKIELFLFYSRLIKDFKIKPNPNEPLPSLAGELGITLSPAPFKVVFQPRNNNLN